MSDLLLDTCAVIWMGNGDPIDAKAKSHISDHVETGGRILTSPFVAWELGVLVARSRIRLPYSVSDWFSLFLNKTNVQLAKLPPETLVDSSFLPGTPPKDPADRIMIATARHQGLAIVTRDQKILNYAHDGHVQALPC